MNKGASLVPRRKNCFLFIAVTCRQPVPGLELIKA